MDGLEFFGLQPTDDPCRWRMPVELRLCSGLGALFGGAGLGACMEVLERVTGRPAVWATAQYLAFAPPGTVLDLLVDESVRGHQVSQARVLATCEGREILTVNAALGKRSFAQEGSWSERPEVPPPGECRPRPILEHMRGTIIETIEMRLADARGFDELDGTPGSGRSSVWVRFPAGLDLSASTLAIVGDYVPFGISQALGVRAAINSIDNTMRIAHRVPTDWVHADIRVHAVTDGFGHGLVHLWAEDGTLLGTASQSTIIRGLRDEEELRP